MRTASTALLGCLLAVLFQGCDILPPNETCCGKEDEVCCGPRSRRHFQDEECEEDEEAEEEEDDVDGLAFQPREQCKVGSSLILSTQIYSVDVPSHGDPIEFGSGIRIVGV